MATLLFALGCGGESSGAADDKSSDTGQGAQDMGVVRDAATAKDLSKDTEDGARVREADMPDAGGEADLSASGADMSAPRVPLVVLQGRMGRTITSCDGGRTWGGDRSMTSEGHENYCGEVQPEAQCERTPCRQMEKGMCVSQDMCVCRDHKTGSATKIDWSGTWFIANFGWGEPGTIQRSKTGLEWEDVTPKERPNVQGSATGGGVTILSGRDVWQSRDEGLTWSRKKPGEGLAGYSQPVAALFIPELGVKGRFLSLGRDQMYWSDDLGETWTQTDRGDSAKLSDGSEQACGHFFGGIGYGNGTLLLTKTLNHWCASTDGGKSLRAVKVEELNGSGAPLFDGKVFHVFSHKHHHQSADGLSWTRTELPRDAWYMGTAWDPHHETFIGWRGDYEKQEFLWSLDGERWERADASRLTQGHGIKYSAVGLAPQGWRCPW